ncbi:protein tesmin/TSO1-like CXC 2 [Euphorbia lathyris]|uniref:protein tesmin/TSO1-like CXC 2 n=1 Tax=Euphorbia lathyris TaxID=212925 RepID=UPI0033135B48
MDTPEKTKITTPLSKFEDSPVFNYINSLSPIKPVKSIPITQTFQSLSFSSLPSIFTSPHVSSHKESRFLRRHNNSDPSKPEFSSGNGNKVTNHEGTALDIAHLYDNSSELQENIDPGVSVGEDSVVVPPNKRVRFATELPQKLKYDCGSPVSDPTPRCGPQVDCMSALDGISASEICRKSLPEREANLQAIYQSEQKTEATDSDWENLLTDAADLLIFNSPIDSETFNELMQRTVDPHEVPEMQIDHVGSGEDELEYPSTQPGETVEPNEINRAWESFATSNSNNARKGVTSNPSEEAKNEMEMSHEMVVSNLHRGMRRRCLDFETVVARRKNLNDHSNSSASNGVQLDEKLASKDKQLMLVNPGSDSSRRVLPGIGLHLNALTIISKDSKTVNIEASSSEISLHSPGASFQSPISGQELIDPLTLASEPEIDPTENGVLLLEDVSQTSNCLIADEFNHNSPKKRRRKLEGENEGCKRCNCKKSKCLKLYCECFAAGVYCIEPCSCQECFNKPIHEDTVLATRKQIESRNPLAFAPKVIRGSETVVEIGDDSNKTPASARHKRGCNCKKSNCLKKYCECYQGGVGCSINCRCEGCKNAFGRKDGSAPPETEAEVEEETEGEENNGPEKASQKIEIRNIEEHNPNNAIPATPLSISRPLLQLPFSSKGKPPRSFLGIGSSSGLYTSQKYGKLNILRPEQKFERQLQTVPDEDMPDILRDNYSSPSTGIKTSPNSKRVSPPHSIIRSGRKLILQSIPSFPSLTPHQ